jgi:hypothetical protein
MMANSLIDATIREIAQAYQPGTLAWMKTNWPDDWTHMLTLEGRVNEMALESDLGGLREALSEYQGLILSMVKEFKAHKGETGNLLEQRVFSFQMERPKSPGTG